MAFLKHIKIAVIGAAAAFAAVSSGPVSAPASASDSVLADIQKRGVLRVGVSMFVPWAMRGKSGGLVGFEIDVAKKAAKDMGVEVEFVPAAWSGIIPALTAGKFDVIISGMSVTPQRSLAVSFTRPYAHSGKQMAAGKDLAGGWDKPKDFSKPGVTITCRRGATPCAVARRMFPLAQVRPFDDDAQAFQEVVNGNAHAVIASAPEPRFWAEDHPDKVFLPFNGRTLTKSDEAFALRKGDTDALNFFNSWIVANISSGWLKERHDFWFQSRRGWKDMTAPDQ